MQITQEELNNIIERRIKRVKKQWLNITERLIYFNERYEEDIIYNANDAVIIRDYNEYEKCVNEFEKLKGDVNHVKRTYS